MSYSYIAVDWLHVFPDHPNRIYDELDEGRNEIRKVEEFRDGSLTYADHNNDESDKTCLSWLPVPSEEEITQDAEFRYHRITKADFEIIWNKAVSLSE